MWLGFLLRIWVRHATATLFFFLFFFFLEVVRSFFPSHVLRHRNIPPRIRAGRPSFCFWKNPGTCTRLVQTPFTPLCLKTCFFHSTTPVHPPPFFTRSYRECAAIVVLIFLSCPGVHPTSDSSRSFSSSGGPAVQQSITLIGSPPILCLTPLSPFFP